MTGSKKSPPPIVYIAGSLALAGLGYFAYGKLGTSPPPAIVQK
jgi:hypothetical protein